MKSWPLFRHAFLQVKGNMREALQISGLLWAVLMLLSLLIRPDFENPQMNFGLVVLVFLLIQLLVTAIIAVEWHRFILLGEYPKSYIPVWHGSRVLRYIWTSFLISLVIGLASVAVAIPYAIIAMVSGTMGLPEMVFAGISVVFIVALVIFLLSLGFRISLSLPSVALDRKISFSEAWDKTREMGWMFVRLAVITSLFTVLVSLPAELFRWNDTLYLVIGYIANWISTMVGISVLTTLYGVIIENRKI